LHFFLPDTVTTKQAMGGHDDVLPRLWRLAYDKRDLLIREWSGSSLDPSKISLLFASLHFLPGVCLPLTPPTAEQGRAQEKKDVGLDFGSFLQ